MKTFLDYANKKMKCRGISAGLRLRIHILLGSGGYLLIVGCYDFASVSIKNNNLIGYPSKSINHEFGVRFGFGFVTNS
jgi:hypothetical protein